MNRNCSLLLKKLRKIQENRINNIEKVKHCLAFFFCILIKRGGDGGKGKISKVVTKGKFIIAGGLG